MDHSTPLQWLVLAAIICVTLLPGMVIGQLTANPIKQWYSGLRKPSWNPPNWLFAPVWTTLYLAMSVAAWMVWRTDPQAHAALALYSLQLVLNHIWSPIFFLLRKPAAAFFELCLLWLTVAFTIWHFHQVCPRAAQLMLPYLAWLSFAGLLNFRIWRDNRYASDRRADVAPGVEEANGPAEKAQTVREEGEGAHPLTSDLA